MSGQATTRAKLTVHPDLSKMMQSQQIAAPAQRVVSPPSTAPKAKTEPEPTHISEANATPTATDNKPELAPFEAIVPLHAKKDFKATAEQQSAVQEYIRREGEAPPLEDLYDKENPRAPKFKTQIKDLNLWENDAAHFECKLLLQLTDVMLI